MPNTTEYQCEIFANRCLKKIKTLRKWARKNAVTCYRIYDRDIPEVPLAVDLYEFLPKEISSPKAAAAFVAEQAAAESQNIAGAAEKRLCRTYLKVFLYERPPQFQKSDSEEQEWLFAICSALEKALGVEQSHIVCKTRRHEKGGSQYAASTSSSCGKPSAASTPFGLTTPAVPAPSVCGNVFENGSLFFVNLSDYLDTGLFLDMRKMRSIIKTAGGGKRVLNLFCYTSSFSVAALSGGAAFVQSVDLSNTYLEWSEKNFLLNGFSDKSKYAFTRSDVLEFLTAAASSGFDIIILDPPTFSNSKKTRADLDLNRDWSVLVNACLKNLNKGGALYFSTNSKRLSFDKNLVENNSVLKIEEITEKTIDIDFEQKRSHRAWLVDS